MDERGRSLGIVAAAEAVAGGRGAPEAQAQPEAQAKARAARDLWQVAFTR
jgi:hypothetical protein